MNSIEQRIRSVPDGDVYENVRLAYPDLSDAQIIAELTQMIVFVAVCWNDAVEDGQDPNEVLERHIFTECDEIAQSFPWPSD